MTQRTCDPHNQDIIRHIVALPIMCPVSKNPQPGSTLLLQYTPQQGLVLDVDDLADEILQYVHGHPSGVRDMETTIQRLCEFAASAVKVPVTALADLLIYTSPGSQQRLQLQCTRVA